MKRPPVREPRSGLPANMQRWAIYVAAALFGAGAAAVAVLTACGHGARASAGAVVATADACDVPSARVAAVARPEVDAGLFPQVETGAATSLGDAAFSPNGRIHPHGRPTTYFFEYGTTPAYGGRTPATALSARRAAYYKESWNSGHAAGWAGGMAGKSLRHVPSGGVDGGFVRYALPGDIDAAHSDGIGANELVQYMYPSAWEGGVEYAAFGGGNPDMRGARITVHVRGKAWIGKDAELVFWLQSTPNFASSYAAETARWSNWAFTGFSLAPALTSGKWQKVEYQLVNDTTQWTYAGHYVAAERETYVYMPLDEALRDVNGDFFHMLVLFDFSTEPRGTIDVDELEVAYSNRSILAPFNGARLIGGPPSAEHPERLVDGWRHGPDRMWKSARSPSAPLELTYELDHPVKVQAVQLHQNPEWPSKDVEVLVSTDGTKYEPLARGVVPATTPAGANFAYYLHRPRAAPERIRRIRVRILSGYKPEHWGLGEIEIFGEGAVMPTDDEWYAVNTDITGLRAGVTYHYRLVAQSGDAVSTGPDRTFTVPGDGKPEAITGETRRVGGGKATLGGRVNPLGSSTRVVFEYGEGTGYGTRSEEKYAGVQITPRTVTAAIDGLAPGRRYHYRLIAVNRNGTTYGRDATFMAE